ncbi:MAG: FeoA domain-containing protein [Clostridia bacterium]|nr:FeoA domain-containing protein [Clostridia bacterium]
MLLLNCKENGRYVVKNISADKTATEKLRKLGFADGVKFFFLKKYPMGGAIVETEGVKIGMGVAVAEKIEVETCEK